jgi:hypothetical protein
MAKWPRNRAPTASRKTRQLWRGAKPRLSASEAATALARAWTVTTVATTLLFLALAIGTVWDRAIFVQALRDALSGDGQLPTQPVDEATADPRQAAAILRGR